MYWKWQEDRFFDASPRRRNALRLISAVGLAALLLGSGPAAGQSAHLVKDIKPGISGSFDRANGSAVNYTTPVAVGDTLFFAADDGVHGMELWKSDGTGAGTVMVRDINPGAAGGFPKEDVPGDTIQQELVNIDGTVFFVARDGVHHFELWKSDGTEAGTVMVKDIQTGSYGSYPNELTNLGGTLFFTAYSPSQGAHRELWRSDGTDAGTVRLTNIYPNVFGGWSMGGLTAANGMLFFHADDGIHGSEPWVSDGSAAGTVMLKDIRSSGLGHSHPSEFVSVNGTVVFQADDGNNIHKLWKTDGTEAGTVFLGFVNRLPSVRYLTEVGGTLFFNGDDDYPGQVDHGKELWKSDGTDAGTVLVKDIRPGTHDSFPKHLIDVGGTLFFAAQTSDQPANSWELWRSDGTEAGTVMVKDTWPGPNNPVNYSPDEFVEHEGLLYFRANDSLHGYELWLSDGTDAGTMMVQDIDPGTGWTGDPYWLTGAGEALFFRHSDDAHGRELWRLPVSRILYAQTDNSSSRQASQDFEAFDDDYDCLAADDFVVPVAATQWEIGRVTVGGSYSAAGGPMPLLNVEFLTDASGLPGAPVCSYPGLMTGTDFTDTWGGLGIVLPSLCTLSPGTYWLVVQADMDFEPQGQWFWGGRSLQSHAPFAWRNPGDGFDTGCTDWTSTCGAPFPDLVFGLASRPGCLSSSYDLELTNRTIDATEVFEACNSLTVGPDLRVLSTGDVEFRSTTVVLRNGFSVEAGAALTVGE